MPHLRKSLATTLTKKNNLIPAKNHWGVQTHSPYSAIDHLYSLQRTVGNQALQEYFNVISHNHPTTTPIHRISNAPNNIQRKKDPVYLDTTVLEEAEVFDPQYKYSWQNPHLRETIYTSRDEKLRDFLLYYQEVDLVKDGPANPAQSGAEITVEVERLQTEYDAVQSLITKADQILTLEKDIKKLQAQIDTMNDKIAKGRKTAADLAPLTEKMTQKKADFEKVSEEYYTNINAYSEKETIPEQQKELKAKLKQLAGELKQLPKPSAKGYKSRDLAKWELAKKRRELEALDHDQLLKLVIEKFGDKPERFPKWLQYMVVHFSGMRYHGAHGSWFAPQELLILLKKDQIQAYIQLASEDMIVQEAQAIIAQLAPATTNKKLIAELEKEKTRRTAVLKYKTTEAVAKLSGLDDHEAAGVLKAMKSQFPAWVWKEIVRFTPLRLEVMDTGWESLTPEEKQAKEAKDPINQRWKEIMRKWQSNSTGWREKHAEDLSLVVVRAVCNEVAEHIQHLRGHEPKGGLTAKPPWYLKEAAKPGSEAYFKRPSSKDDFKPGASLLFMKWNPVKTHAWAIAHPLAGVDFYTQDPGDHGEMIKDGLYDEKGGWTYHIQDNEIYRTHSLACPPEVTTETAPYREWLQWSHEATVVEVAAMLSGDVVLTFETGSIGLIKRNLAGLINKWNVFVGYIPEKETPPDFDAMMTGLLPKKKETAMESKE